MKPGTQPTRRKPDREVVTVLNSRIGFEAGADAAEIKAPARRARRAVARARERETAANRGGGAVEDAAILRSRELDPARIVHFRPYQLPVFTERAAGIVVLHWSRQIGKSFVLAAWAVDRLLMRPGRLVTVLSNSRDNGAEFVLKCGEVCGLLDELLRERGASVETGDWSPDLAFANMRMEIRITLPGADGARKTGRIKVLAANPRTARGFSGDLILDEFAHHENSNAIWEAAEPILASNPDFLCRIASTGNGKHNMFYRLAAPAATEAAEVGRGSRRAFPGLAAPAAGEGVEDGGARHSVRAGLDAPTAAEGPHPDTQRAPRNTFGLAYSQAGFPLSRVTRAQAHGMGVKIYDPLTRAEITPAEARLQALDKRAYDQNYECAFADENLTLLSHELISAAERADVGFICEQDWTAQSLELLRGAQGSLWVGFDVGRKVDLSVITVLEDWRGLKLARAVLRLRDLRLPDQQTRLGEICRLPKFRRAAIDMTGLGLGLFEYAQKEFGPARIHGINFATTVPVTPTLRMEGRKRETARVTEALALELLRAYEDRRLQHPIDARLRDDLRKPERITTPGGRVSIAATRDEAGHADHFWSFALALEAGATGAGPFAYERVKARGGPAHRRALVI